MQHKTAGLLGVIAGLSAMGTAQAATHPAYSPPESLQVSSYADLLRPVADAAAQLKAHDAMLAAQAAIYGTSPAPIIRTDDHHHHHHHHHHHAQYYAPPPPPVYHHHHHHHHQGGVTVVVPGIGIGISN